MDYKSEKTLKDGQKLIIRVAEERDAQGLIDLLMLVDTETKFLAREPGEFSFTLEQEQEFLKNMTQNESSQFLIGEINGIIIANCSVGVVMNKRRFLHRAAMGITVMKNYWSLGIGKVLMLECIDWCKEKGIEQLELEVVADNDRAIALYINLGFEIFGTKKHALKYSDGTYADEYSMILFLNHKKNNLEMIIENTINWALKHMDSTQYRFMCLGFVEDALEQSNHIEIFGGDSAKESADLYKDSLFTGVPPKGSFVFYDCSGPIKGMTMNWGHVGLSIGDGKVIHAWDKVRIDDYLTIELLGAAPGWEQPHYIGWVPLERILVGHCSKNYLVENQE